MANLTSDSKARKAAPMATGCLDYFPLALAEVAKLSVIANDKHNPGEPLHWSKDKSNDHADCLVRHLADRGTPDADMGGLSHTAAVAWRALALLQIELEAAQANTVVLTFDSPEPAYTTPEMGDFTHMWGRGPWL
jgi:hypothetical protein